MIAVKITDETRNTFRESDGVNPCWAWCIENFGIPDTGRWTWDTIYTFTFNHEEDATLFALRWV